MAELISILIIFTFLTSSIYVVYRNDIKLAYLNWKNPSLQELFPEHIYWEQGDVIVFYLGFDQRKLGTLLLMSRDSLMIKNEYGNKHTIKAWQIDKNQSVEDRKIKENFITYHQDILPMISEKNFPQLQKHLE